MESAFGCDVSKASIDVALVGHTEKRWKIANERRAIERLARTLPAGSRIGMESTGAFHELLAESLFAAGHCVFVINPRWIRAYARGLGMRGKSDRTDAMVIARYIAAEGDHRHRYQPPSPELRELRRLLQRRLTLARLAAATQQSLGSEAAPLLQQFKCMLKALERRIRELIQLQGDWRSLYRRLQQLPGVGALTAAQLLASLARVPFSSVDAFVAHTGTDPRPNDSGQKRGRRRLTHHGSADLRTLLYMAAMTACRTGEWLAYFQAQRAKGLSATAAYVIVARKLARIAYSMFKTGQEYDGSRQPLPATA